MTTPFFAHRDLKARIRRVNWLLPKGLILFLLDQICMVDHTESDDVLENVKQV